MFFHVFKNSFVITSHIPSQIRLNYPIQQLLVLDSPIDILDYLAKNHDEKEIIFYQIRDELFNPVLQKYCLLMGLDYDMYLSIIGKAYSYYDIVVYPYEPMFKDVYELISPKRYSMRGQTIPWNHGIVPFEFWINHVGEEEYATNIYLKMYRDSRYEKKEKGTLWDFINDPYYNMCFNTEFDCLYFNKNLMNILIDKEYILRGEKSNITEDKLKEYNTVNAEEKPNYDNQSIYKNVSDKSNYSLF